MSVTSEKNAPAQQGATLPGSTVRTQERGANFIAGLKIPNPVIVSSVALFRAGVTPDVVEKELYKVLSKTYDPATAKALAEKAVFDALKTPEGAKALFDSKIANQKTQQEAKNFIDGFVQEHGDDPKLMGQLNTYLKNLGYDSYVKMGVVVPGMSGGEAAEAIEAFLLDTTDGAPDGGISPEEAKSLANSKTVHLATKDSGKEFSEISSEVLSARFNNPDDLTAAKSELTKSLINRGYSPEAAAVLSEKLMTNYVRGDADIISDDAALIIYNQVSGSSADEVPAELTKSLNSTNDFSAKMRSFMHLTEGWSKSSAELKQQLDLETINSTPGALTFGMDVATDTQNKLDEITEPGSDGGPSKLDQAYSDGVEFWTGLLEDGTASEADVKEILISDYKLSPKDADTFIEFITSGDTSVVPDSIKQIIDNKGSGQVALFSDVAACNKQIETLTDRLDSFDQSLRSELEAIGVPSEILNEYTAVELTDSKIQAEIADKSGVSLTSINVAVNDAEVTLRIFIGTTEQETAIAQLDQQSFEDRLEFNSGVISKDEYDSRSIERTTLKKEIALAVANLQDSLKQMLDMFIQISSMHP